jgi:ribose-phosphate pyrophosphokinase
MELSLISGKAHPALATAIGNRLGITAGRCLIEAFPDDELQIKVAEPLLGHDVYLIQPTGPPVGRHLLELLLIADACKLAGAARITAVVPYFGYARQDRRTQGGEPVGAKVMADLICTRADRIITVHLHNPAIEGFFARPMEHLFPTHLLADRLKSSMPDDAVLVAPDLGAVKLAQHYADYLDLPVAYVHKERISGERVQVRRIIGDVTDRFPVLVDDMISTGGTMVSAIEALLELECRTPVTLAATHALLAGDAAARLAAQPIGSIIATNSLPQPSEESVPMEIVDIAVLLADAIERVHAKTAG